MANSWRQDVASVTNEGGKIETIVDAGGGVYYIGGRFQFVGGVAANNIAKWNGTTWEALGTGIGGDSNDVYAIAVVSSTEVYAGGQFVNYLYKWDGTSWSTIGTIGGGAVNTLCIFGGSLYVGGYFNNINGTSSLGYFAKRSGTTWSSVGTFDNGILSISNEGSNLYVGGGFSTINGSAIARIARWNGTVWSGMGTPPNYNVKTVAAVSSSEVYVGGAFTQAGGSAISSIARWDGTQWRPLGSGISDTNYDGVNETVYYGGSLYAGGNFTQAGGSAALNIARWNGTIWSSLGGGANSPVRALGVVGSEVLIGGAFTKVDGSNISAGGLAKYGTVWSEVAPVNVRGSVNSILNVGSGVYYVGGHFTSIGTLAANNIAKWDGTGWGTLGSGIDGTDFNWKRVNAITTWGTDLYVGGTFDKAGGSAANRVARWDGNQWHPLAGGVTGPFSFHTVSALAIYNDYLYVGGEFTQVNGSNVACGGIVRWDGSAWSTFTTTFFNKVNTLKTIGSDLYVGGYFTLPTNHNSLAKWNGTQFSSVANGNFKDANANTPQIYTLEQVDSALYVGGDYTEGGTLGSEIVNTHLLCLAGGTSWQVVPNAAAGGVETTEITCVGDTNWSLANKYFLFTIHNYGTDNDYYAWYEPDMASENPPTPVDPAIAGRTGISIQLYPNSSAADIASATAWRLNNELSVFMGTDVTNPSGAIVRLRNPSPGATPDATSGTSGFSINVVQQGATSTNGADGSVTTMTTIGSDLYVGGYFFTAAGIAANKIAKLSGTTWSALGSGINNINDGVYALASLGDNIIVGGLFSSVDGTIPASGLALWEGPDTSAPTVGNSGTITKSSITGTGLTLDWTKATDSVSSQANLQYLAYYSLNSLMSSVSDIETYGTAVGTYTADINTKAVTGLTSGSTYYFNVIVKDEAGNQAAYAQVSQVMDGTAPVVGNSGIITTSGVGQTGVTLNWTKATDAVSAQANLQYLAYYSTSSSFDSILEVEAGTAVGTYTADINTKAVTGLTAATTYYFNVIVKDEVGNEAVYAKKMQATSASETTVIDGDNATVDDGETATWGSTGSGLTLTASGEVLSGGEVILQITSLDDLTGTAYFIEVKAGASLTFDGKTITPKSGTIYRLRPRT